MAPPTPFSSSKFHLLNQIFNLKNVFFHGGIINFSFKLVNSFLRKNIRNNNITVISVPFHFDWITNKSSHRFLATRTAFQQKVKLKSCFIFFLQNSKKCSFERVWSRKVHILCKISQNTLFFRTVSCLLLFFCVF